MVGPVVERLVGTRTFLAFYLASGLVGSAVSLSVHPLTTAVGASGAIIGLYSVLLAMTFERHPTTPLTLRRAGAVRVASAPSWPPAGPPSR